MSRPAAAVAACFAAQLALALLVIPPWQNPDEPQHLMTTRLVALHGADFVLDVDRDATSERAIVASMARHGWWTHYGRSTPSPVPATFAEGPAHVVGDYFGPPGGGSRLYYRIVAVLVTLLGIEDIPVQLYAMRLLSALAAGLTLMCIWAGTRVLLDVRSAFVVTALAALHPQFTLVSTTASPDAFVNLAGGLVWWQAAVLLTSPRASTIPLLLTSSVLGFLTRRMGATLVIIAAALVVIVMLRRLIHGRIRVAPVALVTGLGLAAASVAVMLFVPSEVYRAVDWAAFNPMQSVDTIAANATRLPRFGEGLFTTFWLSAGWLRYPGPAWWQLAMLVLTAGAVAGTIVALATDPAQRRVVALAGGMVTLQVGAVVAYHFGIMQSGGQGRYLFPVLPAIACLVWIGWSQLAARYFSRSAAAAGLLGIMALLALCGWTLVIIPAFA